MTMIRKPLLLATVLAAGLACGGAKRAGPTAWLGLPLQCRFGTDCFVQSYVDDDPGAPAPDYMCGTRAYPGHNGTDFRLKSMVEQRAGVAVLSVARGRVLRVRDGVPDVSVKARGHDAVSGEECGNGIVVDQGRGWESQYCHLAKGSLRVKPGQRVREGQPIARVGLSGDTEFPHVHYTLRFKGRVIDPFAYGAAPASCGGGVQLWKQRLPYQAGQVLLAGFATDAVSLDQAVTEGEAQQPRPTRQGAALVAFVEAMGLKAGDVQRIRLHAPDGSIVADGADVPLPADRAVSIWSVGRKTPPGGWPAGVYQADFSVHRNGVDRIVRTFRITL